MIRLAAWIYGVAAAAAVAFVGVVTIAVLITRSVMRDAPIVLHRGESMQMDPDQPDYGVVKPDLVRVGYEGWVGSNGPIGPLDGTAITRNGRQVVRIKLDGGVYFVCTPPNTRQPPYEVSFQDVCGELP